jgi:hypothetical protein
VDSFWKLALTVQNALNAALLFLAAKFANLLLQILLVTSALSNIIFTDHALISLSAQQYVCLAYSNASSVPIVHPASNARAALRKVVGAATLKVASK